jgi:hypothetical protein
MFGTDRAKGALAVSATGLAAASLIVVWMLGGFGLPSEVPSSADPIGGPFRLTGADGQSVSDRDFRGQ